MISAGANVGEGATGGDIAEAKECPHELLGATCYVHLADSSVKRGFLLEVRYLWSPRMVGGKGSSSAAPPLYGFVRMKDEDHRTSGWFPVSSIEVKEASSVNGATSCDGACLSGATACNSTTFVANKIKWPVLSTVYNEVTPGMVRTRREEKQLDFFEERLLRDCRTPTTVRYFIYLCRFVFAPWYYAPYGLLNREYDPSSPLCGIEREALCGTEGHGTVSIDVNPFIRDAYLCPFSLRIYSTFEQMRYETLRYRAGHLRPPGQEIYRDDSRGFSMFEVNGSRHVTYCRHLFLLGKSFLENKLAGHDVHNYYFYVVCLHHRHYPHYTDDTSAMYFVGYFTWEKQVIDNNLACIVTLPYFMGGGTLVEGGKRLGSRNMPSVGDTASSEGEAPKLGHFGQFMIAVSYELAYRRKCVGSPEKPLTDLGAAAYDRYWKRVLIKWMHGLLEGGTATAAVDIGTTDNDKPVAVVSHMEGRDQKVAPGSLKRMRSGARVGDNSVGNEHKVCGAEGEILVTTTIRSVAREVRLEEADVLRTMLQMGVLHLSAEDRSMRIVIPVPFVKREYTKIKSWAHDLTRAEFDPRLLIGRGASS